MLGILGILGSPGGLLPEPGAVWGLVKPVVPFYRGPNNLKKTQGFCKLYVAFVPPACGASDFSQVSVKPSKASKPYS